MDKKLPEKIFVLRQNDGETKYLEAHESVDEIPEDEKGTVVGCYRLTHVRTLSVEKTLSIPKGEAVPA